MIIIKNIEQYNEEYVYFTQSIKNNIMNNGRFIRIIYSNSLFMLNGIYIMFNIESTNIDNFYNKFKCAFNVNQYSNIIASIQEIEKGILNKINIVNKEPKYKIYEQIKNGIIKVFSTTTDKMSDKFLLKISGVWETDIEYGLTYKFINL
jgi:RNAse (barnase) inhibitor barstar